MPELPEVETMRRGVIGVRGGTITDLRRVRCRRKPIAISPTISVFRRRAIGCRIVEVARVGKRIALQLDCGDTMIFEPRMTGLLLAADPPSSEHLRFRLDVSGAPLSRIWFWDRRGLGSVRLLSPAQFDVQLGPQRLGPDALSLTPRILKQRLSPCRRAIKVALLDQHRIAGIGNLYASEILHRAALHPEHSCDQLTHEQWRRLAVAIRQVLREAIRYEGSTLADGTYRNALSSPGSYQNHHRVYDRESQPCPRCRRETIRRIVQAQRSTFFCPRCQRSDW